MVKNIFSKLYIGIIIFFLYVPIIVLMMLSFSNSKTKAITGGFTLKWYAQLFKNEEIMGAITTTLLLAVLSAVIATIIGLLGAIGIDAMKKRGYSVMLGATNIPLLNADIVTGIALMLFFVRFIPLGFGSMLLAHITFNIPYVILSILPKLKQISCRFIHAYINLF